MVKRFWLLLVLAWPCMGFAQSNEGTDFWLGFMEHRDNEENTMVVMITAKTSAAGTVSMPLGGWSQSFSVAPNQVRLITLPRSAEHIGSEFVSRKGIRVTANVPVSVYIHQYHSFRAEASVVLPAAAIDREYYVLTYKGMDWNGQYYPSEFLLVATEDETEVEITPSTTTSKNKQAGEPFYIRLNAGESYQVQSRFTSDDLTGSRIRSDQPLAVFAGCRWTEVPNGCGLRDNLLEQMYPVSTWGRRFVTVPSAGVRYDVFRILASENNTVVELDGNTPRVFNLDAGEYAEYSANEPAYIAANKPIQVAQYLIGSGCNGLGVGDPSFVLLNSVEQTRENVTLYSSSFENIQQNYLNIIAQVADTAFIRVDGQPLVNIGGGFRVVGANADFAYAQVRVSAGSHTISSSGCGVIVTAYGYGEVESYAYSGGASFTRINANPIPEGACLNDTIFFDTGLSPDRYEAYWDLGDGTTSRLHHFEHQYRSLGSYPVRLITIDRCLDERDTTERDLMVTLRRSVSATDAVEVCVGEAFQLAATDLAGARYEWRGPNAYFSTAQEPVFPISGEEQSGDYEVIGIISGCATYPAVTEVLIHPNPEPYLGEDTLICTRSEDFSLVLDPGPYVEYEWQDGSGIPTYQVEEAGSYRVEVLDQFGCRGSGEVRFRELCPTVYYAPNAFSPNEDGVNDRWRIFITDITDYELRIFDRWGNELFYTTDPNAEWDGRRGRRPAGAGVYTWMMRYAGYEADGRTISKLESGELVLLR